MNRVPSNELERRYVEYHSRLVRYSGTIIGSKAPAFKDDISNDAAIDAILEVDVNVHADDEFYLLAYRTKSRTSQRLRKKGMTNPPECLREEQMDASGNQINFFESTLDDITEKCLGDLSKDDRPIVEAWLESPTHGSIKSLANQLDVPYHKVFRVIDAFRKEYRIRFKEQEQ